MKKRIIALVLLVGVLVAGGAAAAEARDSGWNGTFHSISTTVK